MNKSTFMGLSVIATLNCFNNIAFAEQMCAEKVPCLINFEEGVIDPDVITFLKNNQYDQNDWILTKDNGYNASYALQTPPFDPYTYNNVTEFQISTTENITAVTFKVAGELFDYEPDYYYYDSLLLSFYVDEKQVYVQKNNQGMSLDYWYVFTFSVSPGAHTFRWAVDEDLLFYSYSGYTLDTLVVDEIEFIRACDFADEFDKDCDGVPDEIELEQGTDPEDTESKLDTDEDSVPDYLEGSIYASDINVADALDSDNDSVSDYSESYPDSNEDPLIEDISSQSIIVGEYFSIHPVASDADGDDLIYSIENKPDWLNFDPTTGELSGIASYQDVKDYNRIRIAATDGSFTSSNSSSKSFNINYYQTSAPYNGGNSRPLYENYLFPIEVPPYKWTFSNDFVLNVAPNPDAPYWKLTTQQPNPNWYASQQCFPYYLDSNSIVEENVIIDPLVGGYEYIYGEEFLHDASVRINFVNSDFALRAESQVITPQKGTYYYDIAYNNGTLVLSGKDGHVEPRYQTQLNIYQTNQQNTLFEAHQTILPPKYHQENFGRVIALENNILVTTAKRNKGRNIDGQRVLIYQKDSQTLKFKLIQVITPSENQNKFSYAHTIAIDEGLLIVSSTNNDNDNDNDLNVFQFDSDSNQFVLRQRIDAADSGPDKPLGSAMLLANDNWLLIDPGLGQDKVSAFSFNHLSSQYELRQEFSVGRSYTNKFSQGILNIGLEFFELSNLGQFEPLNLKFSFGNPNYIFDGFVAAEQYKQGLIYISNFQLCRYEEVDEIVTHKPLTLTGSLPVFVGAKAKSQNGEELASEIVGLHANYFTLNNSYLEFKTRNDLSEFSTLYNKGPYNIALVARDGELTSSLNVKINRSKTDSYLALLPDIDKDGKQELAEFTGHTLQFIEPLSGQQKSNIKWEPNPQNRFIAAELISLPDLNSNGYQDTGFFDHIDTSNGTQRYILVAIDGLTQEKYNTYKWPGTWYDVNLTVLPDLNSDGVAEIALQGKTRVTNATQLAIKDGSTTSNLYTYSFPDNWDNARYAAFTDVNNDGVSEIAFYGQLKRNGKPQIRIMDGTTHNNQLNSYTFPDHWENISWHRLSDLNQDGLDEWGMFGVRRDNGRPQLMVKNVFDSNPNQQTFTWPVTLSEATFLSFPDINGDGIDEVAAAGLRTDGDRFQVIVKDGADRHRTLANYGWPNKWTETSVHLVGDLNDDGMSEVALFGKSRQGKYQLIIKNGDPQKGNPSRWDLGDNWLKKPRLSVMFKDNSLLNEDIIVTGVNKSARVKYTLFKAKVTCEGDNSKFNCWNEEEITSPP